MASIQTGPTSLCGVFGQRKLLNPAARTNTPSPDVPKPRPSILQEHTMTDTASLIRELDTKRREAMVAADVDILDELFCDDLTWIHATARVDTKKGLLSSIGGGATKYLSIRVEDETVRTFNGMALLSGVAIMEAEIKGERRDLHNRFTIVWVQVGDSWRVLNWQSTSVR